MKTTFALALGALALLPLRPLDDDLTPFSLALDRATRALDAGELDRAKDQLERALERDLKSPRVWELRARWAEAADDRDELVYALHQELRLRRAQEAKKGDLRALQDRLIEVDPVAKELLGMKEHFIDKLLPLAVRYEKEGRPHSAIRVHKQILALDPENTGSQQAIDRIASVPDPSLAEYAKPKDLLAGVSEEWIREFDAQHVDWKERAKLERENYVTYTNAGYEVLVRAAEAMEQMNAFYRVFFAYGTEEDGGSVPRINLHIFKEREEYLEMGIGPPVEWSGGHFTGGAVETYIAGQGGFVGMTQTLFHEAAHQFVSLATNAVGWLNEGLASFFEGCRIQSNGSVLMNMPATGRLFPLADRMEKGWMSDAQDGIDPDEPSTTPERAPTFRIVVENEYSWGPPWYAPTWGVVYFLYNYQDPIDGRFVYRDAFREYIDKSGGRVGKGAVKTFEEVVLGNPSPELKGVERPDDADELALPETIDELDEVWKEWILELRDIELGSLEVDRPYLDWARYAVANKKFDAAHDHFEKGLVATPDDTELLRVYAEFKADRGDVDRATQLVLEAIRLHEDADEVDEDAVKDLERMLSRWDPKRASLGEIQQELWTRSENIVEAYRGADLHLMALDVCSRLGTELAVPGLFKHYEEIVRETGKTLQRWKLVYNEKSLVGWDVQDADFEADGVFIRSRFGEYEPGKYDFRMMVLDEVTSGDFSFEMDVSANTGQVGFCGMVFGRKDAQNFHAVILFPPKDGGDARTSRAAFVDLATFFGGGSFRTWRHLPLEAEDEEASRSETWHTLRVDVSGTFVDVWCDGEYLTSQEFGSKDVLRGTFGIVTGPGEASYKSVRFMGRHPRDPAARIEREVRLEKVKGSGGAVGGSWLGQVPPFPKIGRWAQGERSSWEEAGPVPQLLVMWSIEQNGIVPIDGWLRDLADRTREVGLEIVSVCSPNDDKAIEAYLEEHPFPGHVAVDFREGPGFGDSNKMFSTIRFGLPRLLLLDVNGEVVWEGDPGFSAAEPWPDVESYLEVPLAELVESRRILELRPWLESWKERGADALHDGDLQTALPILRKATEFDATVMPEIYDVQRKLEDLERSLGNMPDLLDRLKEGGHEPAAATLNAWAAMLEIELPKKTKAAVSAAAKSSAVKHWDRAKKMADSYRKRVVKDPSVAAELIEKLENLKGAFPAQLAGRVRSAGTDGEALHDALTGVDELPRLWVARDLFAW